MEAVHRDERGEGIHADWAQEVGTLALVQSLELAYEHRLGCDVPRRGGPTIIAATGCPNQGGID